LAIDVTSKGTRQSVSLPENTYVVE
jgi:hypothetical protein